MNSMSRLSFLSWGIRPFNIALFMAYPVMGAVFAMPEVNGANIFKLLVFCALNVPFIAHVYILNDWSDAKLNPKEADIRDKHALKHPEVVTEREVLLISAILVFVSLLGFLVLSRWIFLLALVMLAITFFYSHPRFTLKRYPPGAALAHFSGASLYFLAGWILFQPLSGPGYAMAFFFGMVIVAGNFFNEIEDFNYDLAAGLRTAPVAYGQRPVFRTALFSFAGSSLYFVILSLARVLPFNLAWPGMALLVFWGAEFSRYRNWRGGDAVGSIRLYGRVAYAVFCFAVLVILMVEKM
jgi:4-hydroxybenzoate polyprenyltransferase